jgi:hypothetical protein
MPITRSGAARLRRQLRNRDRRGVRRQNDLRPCNLVQLLEDRLLHLKPLRRRLNHEIRIGQRAAIQRPLNPLERVVDLIERNLPLLRLASQVFQDRLEAPIKKP